jgi:predicted metal-dependent hydrolase
VRRILLDGREVPYTLVRTRAARRVSLRVDDRGLRVSAPPRASLRTVEAALRSHAGWVLRHLDRAEPPPPLVPGARLALLGGHVELSVALGARPQAALDRAAARLEVTAPSEDLLAPVIEHWYREAARAHLGALAVHWAPALGVQPSGLRIGDQRSRWGSCSTSGTISLSWRLLLAPPEVGEYVVVHELAHLRRPDHSPAFWAIVAAALPGHAAQRRWLRRHGAELRLGPAVGPGTPGLA